MRVIAGTARGRKLIAPGAKDGVRPITDRGKESLFNILGPRIQGSRFLDLFAGTGAVGIEALSRGADHVVFNEQSVPVLKLIRRNLQQTRLEENSLVIHGDAFSYLRRPVDQFDFIFIAPPQYHGMWEKALRAVDADRDWLTDEGLVIVQIDPSEFRLMELETLRLTDRRKYSNVQFCFYRPLSETS